MSIETCDLTGRNRKVVVPSTDLWLQDYCWLADGRIVYSRQESSGSGDANLWQISIDVRTGKPTGKPPTDHPTGGIYALRFEGDRMGSG
jgi:hypothetical protein